MGWPATEVLRLHFLCLRSQTSNLLNVLNYKVPNPQPQPLAIEFNFVIPLRALPGRQSSIVSCTAIQDLSKMNDIIKGVQLNT